MYMSFISEFGNFERKKSLKLYLTDEKNCYLLQHGL